MKVYNRGRRVFNNNTEFAVHPGKWTEIPDEMGQQLIKDHPREITTNSEAITTIDPKLAAENEALKKKIAQLEAHNAGLQRLIGGQRSETDLVSSTREPEAPAPVEPPAELPVAKPVAPAKKPAPAKK